MTDTPETTADAGHDGWDKDAHDAAARKTCSEWCWRTILPENDTAENRKIAAAVSWVVSELTAARQALARLSAPADAPTKREGGGVDLETALETAEKAVHYRDGEPVEDDLQPFPCFTVCHLRVLIGAARQITELQERDPFDPRRGYAEPQGNLPPQAAPVDGELRAISTWAAGLRDRAYVGTTGGNARHEAFDEVVQHIQRRLSAPQASRPVAAYVTGSAQEARTSDISRPVAAPDAELREALRELEALQATGGRSAPDRMRARAVAVAGHIEAALSTASREQDAGGEDELRHIVKMLRKSITDLQDRRMAVENLEALEAHLAHRPDQEAGHAGKPDGRYPFVYHDRNDWQRMGVSVSKGDDFVRVDTLLENKPGGKWAVVDMTPDEAEQMGLRLLERARVCRSNLQERP